MVTIWSPQEEIVWPKCKLEGYLLDEVPKYEELYNDDGTKTWRGWGVATVQPKRGTEQQGSNLERTANTIEHLRNVLYDVKQ